MMPTLLEVCPSFRAGWKSFLDYWKNEPECEPPLYIALTDLARHIIGMLANGETESFPAIFAAVERLQLEGEHYVREAAIVGLLEDLKNLNLHTATEPEQFRQFLGPESVAAWDELDAFWHQVGVLKSAGLLEPRMGPAQGIDLESVQDPQLRQILQSVYGKR